MKNTWLCVALCIAACTAASEAQDPGKPQVQVANDSKVAQETSILYLASPIIP